MLPGLYEGQRSAVRRDDSKVSPTNDLFLVGYALVGTTGLRVVRDRISVSLLRSGVRRGFFLEVSGSLPYASLALGQVYRTVMPSILSR